MSTENSIGALEYLDSAFFDDVLENGLREANVTTKNISISLGCSGGENYCSQIYRANVTFQRAEDSETEQTSVIVKSIPLSKEVSFLDDMKVFHKEKVFYMDILPKLEILLDNIKIAPRCYFARKKPALTIVFEDMTDQGYIMANRETGLDEHHTKFALQKLGQFHAVSMVYAKKEPTLISQYKTGILNPKALTTSCALYKVLYKYLGYLTKMVSQWKGYEDIAEKLREFHRNFHTRLIAAETAREGKIKVLNHGDFWVNNLLFKYNGDKITDLVFLDFQMSVYASPGIDLNYFLWASVQLDVLYKMDVLLQTYYTSMRDTLLELRYDDIPTYEDIVNEINRKSAYGVFTLFGPLPIMAMDKSKCDGNSFESLSEGNESDEKMKATFSSKRVIDQLRYALKQLDKVGALDK